MFQEVYVHVLSPQWNETSSSHNLVPVGPVSRRSLFSREACHVHLARGDRCGAFARQRRSCNSLSRQPLVYLVEGLHALFPIVSYCSEKRRVPALPIM